MSKVRYFLVNTTDIGGRHVVASYDSLKKATLAGEDWLDRIGNRQAGGYFTIARGLRLARQEVEYGCELCPVVLNGE